MNDLREAIKDVEFSVRCDCEVDTKHLLILSNLAERYLAAEKIMPVKKTAFKLDNDYRDANDYVRAKEYCSGYNQAIEDCTIAHLKIVEGLKAENEKLMAEIERLKQERGE